MANSVAYVLSKNPYTNFTEASNVGTSQGTRIVYASASTLNGSSILYAESDLIQPIYGNGSDWYRIHLLTDTEVDYVINIDPDGSIYID